MQLNLIRKTNNACVELVTYMVTWFYPFQCVRTWATSDFREDAFTRQHRQCIDPTVNFHVSGSPPPGCVRILFTLTESPSPSDKIERRVLISYEKTLLVNFWHFHYSIRSSKAKSRNVKALFIEGLRVQSEKRRHDCMVARASPRQIYRVQVETNLFSNWWRRRRRWGLERDKGKNSEEPSNDQRN